MNAYVTLAERLPAAMKSGKAKAIRDTLAAGIDFRDAVASAAKRDDLAPKGKAAKIAEAAKIAAAVVVRSRRVFQHHAAKIAAQDAALRAKVIGEARPTDAEYRSWLRGLPDGERALAVIRDPAARAAALREPGLSALPPDAIDRAMDAATADIAPKEAAGLADAEAAQEFHATALSALSRELATTAFTVDGASVRAFLHDAEFESWLTDTVEAPHPNALIVELAEADKEAD